jgi:hypothetical protein
MANVEVDYLVDTMQLVGNWEKRGRTYKYGKIMYISTLYKYKLQITESSDVLVSIHLAKGITMA